MWPIWLRCSFVWWWTSWNPKTSTKLLSGGTHTPQGILAFALGDQTNVKIKITWIQINTQTHISWNLPSAPLNNISCFWWCACIRFVYACTIIKSTRYLHASQRRNMHVTYSYNTCDYYTIVCSWYMYHIHSASCILAVAWGVWEGTVLKAPRVGRRTQMVVLCLS